MKNKLLLVDDDDLVLELYSEFFEQNGFDVQRSKTVNEAVRNVKKKTPDIILSDVLMPRKNGFDLFEELKALSLDIPFIFMTGYKLDDSVIEKFKKYNAPWISKPTELKELLKIVRDEIKS